MASVTVLGASGTITVPFKSQANAALAQQLANQISNAIIAGNLATPAYNTTTPPSLPTVVGGASTGVQVFGDNAPATSPSTIAMTAGYPALIVNASNPVTITGSAALGVASIIGGDAGTTFMAGGATNGGSIFLGGGQNLITDGAPTGAQNSTNGGLQGNWQIGTGSSDPADGTLVFLASGSDTVIIGPNDTIAAGGATVLMGVYNADSVSATGPTVFLGTGDMTYFGGTEGGDRILGNGVATGNDVIVLGSGGNSTVVAGTGNATLIGGGDGDLLFGDTSATHQQLWAGGNSTLFGGGASSDTFFGFHGAASTSNVWMSAANGTGENQFWAGAGNDTIWTGLGNDTVLVFSDHTQTSGPAGNDLIFGWNPNSTLWINGYSSAAFSASALGTTLSLSDGTKLTFFGINDPSVIKVV